MLKKLNLNFMACPTKTSLKKDAFGGTDKIFIAKVNSEFIIRAEKNNDFADLLSQADIKIIDGVGVQWAARYLSIPLSNTPIFRSIQAIYQMVYSGASLVLYPKYCTYPIKERIPGIEAFKLMLKTAEDENIPVFIFGGRDEALAKAIPKLKTEFPNLKIAGFANGYRDKENAVDIINETDAQLLFVGLGSPEQEEWIVANLPKLKTVKAAVGEGGTIDRVANPMAKAPKWMSSLGVEWLWRLFTNKNLTNDAGSRFNRVWNGVFVLIYETVKYKIKNGAMEIENEKN